MTLSSVQPQTLASSANSPSNLRLKDIIKSLPREVFLKDQKKAWMTVFINVVLAVAGYFAIAYSPWFLLPFAWIFTGTALTGLFVIGHDCGHRAFADRRWVNDLVGHIAFLPLIYPFHSWRLGHNHHHKHTNKLTVDNAWEPWKIENYEAASPVVQVAYKLTRGRLWWSGSIFHWAIVHFDWRKFEGKGREQVKFSSLFVIVCAAIAFPTMIFTLGIWGFVKFWLMPWLVYHFWMSTFTLVHHTAPGIQFKEPQDWDEALAQLSGTVHCNYPAWVEFLCHDINVHIPHHISTAIPFYNLRKAYQSLQDNWGEYLYPESDFSLSLMTDIVDKCHFYDSEKAYTSFTEYNKH
ncbi:MAG TPA: fatty acid desaturase [Planktothrix sp. UBA8407]|nr:fatty acid desaturase [Planktothrix sp. UBA8407]HBK23130.1 fatty acid desaturase [Planktothrix sp. UBA10369]